jgi:shikimate kinase
MKEPMKIVLVGMPGSGKSTIGKVLARRLNLPFIDLDQLIEKETQRKISEIFSKEGEGHFRDLETEFLNKILDKSEGFVLSTGGGTICFNDNLEMINLKSISIYVDVPLEDIKSRLQKDKANRRPMFAGLDEGEMMMKLISLFAERKKYYEQAKIKLSGEDVTPDQLVSELLMTLRN